MTPTISIIVPVYKVENYLEECLQSLVNQTFMDIEIILVDDGSPDNSPAICDEWADRDARIHVIHKQNGGVCSARNVGIEYAKGEFISFVDSDDFFDKRMYEFLYEGIMRSPRIGIASIKIYSYSEGKVEIFKKSWDNDHEELVKANDFGTLTVTQAISHSSTDKLYRRELLRDIRLREGRSNEDLLFLYDLSKVVKTMNMDLLQLPFYAYYYRMRPESACHSSHPILLAYINNLETVIAETTDDNMRNAATAKLNRTIFEFCCFLLSDTFMNKEPTNMSYLRAYRKRLQKLSYQDVADHTADSPYAKYSFWFVKHCPLLYKLLKRIY